MRKATGGTKLPTRLLFGTKSKIEQIKHIDRIIIKSLGNDVHKRAKSNDWKTRLHVYSARQNRAK